ncbi:MAG: hypothetical protein EAZ76_01925 [Nostocales cyanobacterium]|nr:MAG: hypothetical protein EAZ87_13340 [Nostocales cyanobacterium]TAF20255.1 MAG: hypothetical protein EAZ76_01925 [Nostocales cyanobacterium]
MSISRKSTVSTKNSWFKRNPVNTVAKQREQSSSTNKPETLNRSSKFLFVRPSRKPNSSDNSSHYSKNQPVLPNFNRHSYQPAVIKTQQKSTQDLPMMSQTGNFPRWLLSLHSLYRYSSGIAFCLVAATLAVYGWTVYSQELWGRYYSNLKNLQRHERQLNTTNATLTSKMAKEGEAAGKALVTPSAGETIFLQSTYPGSQSQSSPQTPEPENQIPTSSSLGY